MRSRFCVLFIAILAISVAGCKSSGTGGTGKPESLPETIALSELPSDFRAFHVQFRGGPPVSMGLDSSRSTGTTEIEQLAMLFFTDNRRFQIGDQTMVALYSLDLGSLAQSENNQAPLRLRLRFVPADSIVSLSPTSKFDPATIQNLSKDLDKVLKHAQLSAKKTAQLSNIKQISVGQMIYISDYDDVLPNPPDTNTVANVTFPYIKNIKIWESQNPNGGHFEFNLNLAGINMGKIPNPAETVLFYENTAWPDGSRVVAYADAHCKVLTAEAWKVVEQKMKSETFNIPRAGKLPKLPFPPQYK